METWLLLAACGRRSGHCAKPVCAGCGRWPERPGGSVQWRERIRGVYTRYALYKSTSLLFFTFCRKLVQIQYPTTNVTRLWYAKMWKSTSLRFTMFRRDWLTDGRTILKWFNIFLTQTAVYSGFKNQGRRLYFIFKVFIEYHVNLGCGCISMFSVNLTFDKTLMMQFCYFISAK